MQQARAHLTDNGVFVQWMNVSFLDESLLRSLAATVLSVFPEVRLYRPDPSTLVFLASDRPLDLERRMADSGEPLNLAPLHYSRFGLNTVEDLIAALAAERDGVRALAANAPLITDDHNRISTSSVYELGRGLTNEQASQLLAAYDPLAQSSNAMLRDLKDRVAFDYVARRLAVFTSLDASVPDRLHRIAQALKPSSAGDVIHAIALKTAGKQVQAERVLLDALAKRPDDAVARFEFVRPWLDAFAKGTAPEYVVAEISNLDGPAVAILKGEAFAARNQWQELSQLDPILADAQWTDPWKFEALQLQIDWRTHAPPAAVSTLLANEALALVDRAIVVQPTLALYGLRTRGALAAGRSDALVESIWSYGLGLYSSGLQLPVNERAETQANLELLIKLLDSPSMSAAADAARVSEVRAKLEDAARRLSQA
jgi:hypothetical protein